MDDGGGIKAEFRQIEHTADVAIEAQAPDLPGLFDRCAAGMFSLIAEGERVLAREEHTFAAEGHDLAEVLVGFLRELLWLHTERTFLYAAASFERLEPSSLVAAVQGETADPARHAIVREIKAITYHGLVVEPRGEGWYARVIFDV
jgi:SHS2 domain-containing protein